MAWEALYYPYIHIEDVNWLKATLLLFTRVARMLPQSFTPYDDPRVQPFTEPYDRALLYPANLWTARVADAQRGLARRLERDARKESFRRRYGRAGYSHVLRRRRRFQIHHQKLHHDLQHVLRDSGLAWSPDEREPYDRWAEYVQVDARIGEAIMSTLAIAVATGDGLDIVGDRRSGTLHGYLLEKKQEDVYDALLRPRLAAYREASPEEVFETLVKLHCDLTEVSAESLAELHGDREPLRRLMMKLRDLSSDIPGMDPGPRRNEYLRDASSDVIAKWRADRKNMSSYWRRFFGEGLMEPNQKFLEKVAEKLPEVVEKTGTHATIGAAGAAIGRHDFTTILTGAGAGLAIGIVSHGVKTYFEASRAERESPYRYLTLMEDAGVIFRAGGTTALSDGTEGTKAG